MRFIFTIWIYLLPFWLQKLSQWHTTMKMTKMLAACQRVTNPNSSRLFDDYPNSRFILIFTFKIIIKYSFGGGQHAPQSWHLHVLSLKFSMCQFSGQFWLCTLLCYSLLRWNDSSNIWSNINMFPGLLERRNFRAKMTREK